MYSETALLTNENTERLESKPNSSLTTFAEIIRYRAHNEGDKEAFSYYFDGEDDSVSWTYRDLKNAIAHVSQQLNTENIVGKNVVLLFEPGLAFIAAYLATICSGAIAVPSHPPMGKRQIKRLSDLIQDSRPSLVLYSDIVKHSTPQLESLIENTAPEVKFETLNVPMQPKELEWQPHPVSPHDTAMLQYTSASTGDPKGVQLSHDNLVKNSESIYNWLEPHPSRKGCIWLPPYHDMGLLGGIMQPLYAGFPLVFMSPMHFVQQPIRWLKLISKHKLTTTGAPNFAFQLCVDAITPKELVEAEIDLSSIREIFCGSEPINAATMSAFEEKFIPYGLSPKAINPCYGMAETTLFVSGKLAGTSLNKKYFNKEKLKDGKALLSEKGQPNAQCVVSCGKLGLHFDLQIVDPDKQQQLEEEQVGEIWVSGPCLSKGYWNQKQLNEKAFNNKLVGSEHAYYRTGDLGFIHNGELFVTGRIKDLIIVRGRNLYPQDIERTALSTAIEADKQFAAAFSVKNEDTESFVVVVELKGRPTDAQRIQYKVAITAAITNEFNVTPFDVVLVPQLSIPRTTSGKVQRFACKTAWQANLLRQFQRSRK